MNNDTRERKRLKVLKVGLFAVAGVIIFRLFMIQILQKGEWVAKAEAQHTLENTIKAKRGEIYMMDGSEKVAVVMNEKVFTVILDPMVAEEEELKDAIFTEELKPYLSVDEVSEVLKDRTRRYFVVARNVPREKALKLQEKEVTGMYLQENTKRVYPEGTLAARLLGFVNEDGVGQYGVEGSLNKELSGTDGRLKTIADVNNVALSIGKDNVRVPAVDGKSVVLTVDRNIQARAEQILQQKMDEFGKDHGSVLVMNPRNGEVLAMVDLPGYDPYNYGNVPDASVYTNGVLMDPYAPASVCKGLTFAAGIEEGVMNAQSTYYNTDTVYVDGWPISNASPMGDGPLSIQTAFNYSLNVGSIQALKWLGGEAEINEKGRKILYDYYVNHFGLGKATGIELYEAQGWIEDPVEGDGRNSTYAGMTFGYNLSATMIQVASAYASMVNGGEYYTPTVVKGYIDANGTYEEREVATAVRRTLSEDTSRQMREMLWGTRSWWRTTGDDPAGYYIGGKTGTAEVIRDGGYTNDTVATYVGFGGAAGEMPEYLVMLRLWKDGTQASGQGEALPTFTEISKYLIDYLKIKPGA
ncbi:penicillin-binding protein 2 [Candidatus Saccharibacteria bacterium]|nr:penicillin-binding protein 2 [Candidatus Saccharibacteria bacterium]